MSFFWVGKVSWEEKYCNLFFQKLKGGHLSLTNYKLRGVVQSLPHGSKSSPMFENVHKQKFTDFPHSPSAALGCILWHKYGEITECLTLCCSYAPFRSWPQGNDSAQEINQAKMPPPLTSGCSPLPGSDQQMWSYHWRGCGSHRD